MPSNISHIDILDYMEQFNINGYGEYFAEYDDGYSYDIAREVAERIAASEEDIESIDDDIVDNICDCMMYAILDNIRRNYSLDVLTTQQVLNLEIVSHICCDGNLETEIEEYADILGLTDREGWWS